MPVRAFRSAGRGERGEDAGLQSLRPSQSIFLPCCLPYLAVDHGRLLTSGDVAVDGASSIHALGKSRDLDRTFRRLTEWQSLIDDVINSVNNFVLQVLGSLETGLLTTAPDELGFNPVKVAGPNGVEDWEYPDAKQEIEEGLHKLETLLYSTVDKNFDKFEIYVLRNILSVPADLVNWVRLSHYEVCTLHRSCSSARPDRTESIIPSCQECAYARKYTFIAGETRGRAKCFKSLAERI